MEDIIAELRKRLIDEYGAASTVYPAALMDLIRVENLSDQEVIQEARMMGWI